MPLSLLPSTPHATARALASVGYASDPGWPHKLIRLIDTFALDDLDAAS